MRYDWLFEPISEEAPCGPDLDEEGDEAYLNYVLSAPGRIPERYYRTDNNKPVDRSDIKVKNEVEAISALLKQSRDVRLLCLEARFQSFAGDLVGFADCLVAIAGLLERFWSEVHPLPVDGDFTMRQNVLSGLDDFAQIIQPLQHAPLLRDKRLDQVTFRLYLVATAATARRDDEPEIDVSEISRAISAEENKSMADQSFAAAVAARNALASIREAFVANSGYDYVPDFERLGDFLGKLVALFTSARPDLAPSAAEAPAAGSQDSGESSAPAPAEAARVVAAYKGSIANHAEAAAALHAVETYLVEREPSTPALILVHQARSLVGKSLVQALETLLPEAAPAAILRLDSGTNFQIAMPLMKTLTAAAQKTSEVSENPSGTVRAFAAANRAEAQALIDEVEGFFRSAEPSSPIPLLLSKARSFANRDFDSILRELIVAKEPVAAKS